MNRPGHNPDPPAGGRPDPPANPPTLACSMSMCGCCKKVSELTAALEQEQSRADANADHAKLANQNQATQAKALKTANERIEQLEDGIRKSPCEVMILQDQPWKDCFPVEPCEPCHCVRSLLVEDTPL